MHKLFVRVLAMQISINNNILLLYGVFEFEVCSDRENEKMRMEFIWIAY